MPFPLKKTLNLFVFIPSLLLLANCSSLTHVSAPETHKTKNYTAAHSSAYDNAIKHYRTSFAENPDDLTALLGLTRNLRYAGQAQKALDLVERERVRFPNSPDLLTEKGKIYLSLGDARTARTIFNTVLKEDPNNWQALSGLGIAHDFLGDHSRAVQAYQAALGECPNSASILNNTAISAGMTGDVEAAQHLLLQAASLRPHSERIQNNIELFRKMEITCRNCDAEDYGAAIKAKVFPQDWAYADLACTASAEDMIDALSHSNFIDVKVNFAFDRADLLPEAIETLETMGKALSSKQLRNTRFDLEGHTDATGPHDYNQQLSERRAASVREYLVNVMGIEPNRIRAVGYGEMRLLDPENPYSGVNRRVRITRLP